MLRRRTQRRWLLRALGLAASLLVFLFTKWKENSDNGGQKPAVPFRVAGNL